MDTPNRVARPPATADAPQTTNTERLERLISESKPDHVITAIEVKHHPPTEAMPRSESWGQLGWTFTDRPTAEARLALLCERGRKRLISPRRTYVSAFSDVMSVTTAEVDR